ncbi:MAG: energy transducer TonB [Pseudomonadota bacterium]
MINYASPRLVTLFALSKNWIEQSSGHRLLDRAVTALIERAQPLPSMPNDIEEPNLTLVVPISFVLK